MYLDLDCNVLMLHKINKNNFDKLNAWRTRKKSEPQMGFEPTTLRDLVGCSNHWATGDSMVSKGQFMVSTGTASRGYTAK